MIQKLICKLIIIFIPHCPLNSVETFWLQQTVSLLGFLIKLILSFFALCLLNSDKPWLQYTLLYLDKCYSIHLIIFFYLKNHGIDWFEAFGQPVPACTATLFCTGCLLALYQFWALRLISNSAEPVQVRTNRAICLYPLSIVFAFLCYVKPSNYLHIGSQVFTGVF